MAAQGAQLLHQMDSTKISRSPLAATSADAAQRKCGRDGVEGGLGGPGL
jgi:hypothetical protein